MVRLALNNNNYKKKKQQKKKKETKETKKHINNHLVRSHDGLGEDSLYRVWGRLG